MVRDLTPTDYLPTHLVRVTYDAGPAGHGCRAECDCGWHSDNYGDDDTAADAAAVEHRDEMTDPPDDLDQLINGLLDLQDDIAQAVLWLIDNWTPGLPVPACAELREEDRPAVRLLAYCTSPGDLDHAADLLDTIPADDSEPNTYGDRYRRAVRDFGRVRVDMFTTIANSEAA